jgi:hypothetical protein
VSIERDSVALDATGEIGLKKCSSARAAPPEE